MNESQSQAGAAGPSGTGPPKSEACARDSSAAVQLGWKDFIPAALVIVLSLVLRAGIASIPLERDEGEYAYIAQRWLAGDLPYRDAFDQKPPGVFVAYAALFALGGTSIEAIHWLGHAFVLVTLLFVYLIGRRLFSHVAGVVAAFFTVLLVMDTVVLGNAANTEVFAIAPLSAGLFFSLRAADRATVRDALLVGVSSGLALCFKHQALPVVLFYVAWIAVAGWQARHRVGSGIGQGLHDQSAIRSRAPSRASGFAQLAALIAGGCLVLAPTCLYFVWQGAWSEFYDCVIGHNLEYAGRVPLRFYASNLSYAAIDHWQALAPIFAVALFGLYVAWQRGAPGVRVCLWWWLASFASTSVGGFYREHYFIFIMPAVALLAAYGVEALAPVLEPKRPEWQGRVAAGLAVVIALWPLYFHHRYYWNDSPEMVSRFLYGINPFPESIPLGKLLRENSQPDDRIFICGSEPQILFYAERRSASRYIFVYPLFGSARDAQARQQTALEEVRRSRPTFIVIVDPNVVFTSYNIVPDAPQDLLKELAELVETDYVPFAATTLGVDRSARVIRASHNEVPSPGDAITMRVWKRRDSGD